VIVIRPTTQTMQDLLEEKLRSLILNWFADPWDDNMDVEIGDVIQPTGSHRFFVATTSGKTGAYEPRWPTVRTSTKVTDAVVEWADGGLSPGVFKVIYRGEPHIVPVKLYPFAIVFLRRQRVARGEDNYGGETGFKYWRYEGYASIEVLYKDTSALLPDSDRKAEVQSYLDSKELTQAVIAAFESWNPDDDPVIRSDDGERTIGEFFSDDISNGIEQRPDNVSNRGNVTFHLYTRENDF
jgi:hypothetical protein